MLRCVFAHLLGIESELGSQCALDVPRGAYGMVAPHLVAGAVHDLGRGDVVLHMVVMICVA